MQDVRGWVKVLDGTARTVSAPAAVRRSQCEIGCRCKAGVSIPAYAVAATFLMTASSITPDCCCASSSQDTRHGVAVPAAFEFLRSYACEEQGRKLTILFFTIVKGRFSMSWLRSRHRCAARLK